MGALRKEQAGLHRHKGQDWSPASLTPPGCSNHQHSAAARERAPGRQQWGGGDFTWRWGWAQESPYLPSPRGPCQPSEVSAGFLLAVRPRACCSSRARLLTRAQRSRSGTGLAWPPSIPGCHKTGNKGIGARPQRPPTSCHWQHWGTPPPTPTRHEQAAAHHPVPAKPKCAGSRWCR